MKKNLLLLVLLVPMTLLAREHKEPLSMVYNITDHTNQETIVLPEVDVIKSLESTKYKSYQAKPLRIAHPNDMSVTLMDNGNWRSVPGGEIWQLRFTSENATDMNFGLSEYNLPKGVQLHFLSFADQEIHYDGPYTSQDNESHNELWSAPLPGGDVGLELFVPTGVSKEFPFKVTRVSTGFRDIFKRNGGPGLNPQRQGECNNDVVCPVGDEWRDEIRSVAAYTIGGIDACTGTLLMDAGRTFRPFFITAYHCTIREDNAPSVVTIWNFESVNCGDLSGGSRLDTVSGSTFLSGREDSDVNLLELSSIPPEEFNVHWSGWDRTGNVPLGSVAIHHPGVDEKAISFNTDPLISVDNCIAAGSNTHWDVDNWEDGTTEGGSSGSGIWDPDNHRLVGTLSGGNASCDNIGGSDCYGKFAEAWDNGGPDNENLKAWLDPKDTGIMAIDGSDQTPYSIIPDNDILEVCSPSDAVYNLTISQNDSNFNEVVTLTTSNLPGAATDSFSVEMLSPPGSSVLTLSGIDTVATGNYTFDVEGSSTSETVSASLGLIVNDGVPATTTLILPADNTNQEIINPVFSWNVVPEAASYLLEIATDAGFTNIVSSESTNGTSLVATSFLMNDTTYFWRVTPSNFCGDGVVSAVFSFTTTDQVCFVDSRPIPDNSETGISIDINIPDTNEIDAIQVEVGATHTWVGDLIFILEHNGTSIELANRVEGKANVDFGCNANNVDVIFDDSSDIPVQTSCIDNTDPGLFGILQPLEALSTFEGQELSGVWTLHVSDNVSGDNGEMTSFCVLPVTTQEDLIFTNGFE